MRTIRPWHSILALVLVPLVLALLDAYNVPSRIETASSRLLYKAKRAINPIVVTDDHFFAAQTQLALSNASFGSRPTPEPPPRDWEAHYAFRATHAPRLVCGGSNPTQLAADLRELYPDEAFAVLELAQEFSNGMFRPFEGNPAWLGRDFSWNSYRKQDDDVIFIWEVNTLQHLVILAQAALLSKDQQYLEKLNEHLESWTAANPVDNSINWDVAMEVSLRLSTLVCLEEMLYGLRQMPAVYPLLMKTSYAHARFLAEHIDYPRRYNNHGIFAPLGLYLFASTHPELKESAAWKRFAEERLLEEMDRQYTAAGVHKEFVPTYHKTLLDAFLVYASAKDRAGEELSPQLKSYLRNQTRFLRTVTGPNERLGLFGDSDDHLFLRTGLASYRDTAPTRLLAATLLNDASLLPESPGRWEVAWIRGSIPDIRPVTRMDSTSLEVYPEGIFRMESAGVTLLGNFSTFGADQAFSGHNHADIGSFLLWHDTTPIVIDPGTYTYRRSHRMNNTEWRKYLRSSGAHSTVVVDGRPQATPTGEFGFDRRPAARILFSRQQGEIMAVAGQHQAFPSGIGRAVRLFILASDQVLILDWFPDAQGEHVYEDNVLLARAAQATVGRYAVPGGWFEAAASSAAQQRLYIGNLDPLAGWRSSHYGQLDPTPQFRSTGKAVGNVLLASRFCFSQHDGQMRSPMKIRWSAQAVELQSPGVKALRVLLAKDHANRLRIKILRYGKRGVGITYAESDARQGG